jgi:hypothetical protein
MKKAAKKIATKSSTKTLSKTSKSAKVAKPVNKTAKPVAKKAAKKITVKKVIKKAAKIVRSVKVKNPQTVVLNIAATGNASPEIEQGAMSRLGKITLTHEGAIQLRAVNISKASFPCHILRALSTNFADLDAAEKHLANVRNISPQMVHEVRIPDFVKNFGEKTTSEKSRACVALGFKPSKIQFISEVEFSK